MKNLEYFNVEKDGHCQFNAILPHLSTKNEFSQIDMRREVAFWMMKLFQLKDDCSDCEILFQKCVMSCSDMNKTVM